VPTELTIEMPVETKPAALEFDFKGMAPKEK